MGWLHLSVHQLYTELGNHIYIFHGAPIIRTKDLLSKGIVSRAVQIQKESRVHATKLTWVIGKPWCLQDGFTGQDPRVSTPDLRAEVDSGGRGAVQVPPCTEAGSLGPAGGEVLFMGAARQFCKNSLGSQREPAKDGLLPRKGKIWVTDTNKAQKTPRTEVPGRGHCLPLHNILTSIVGTVNSDPVCAGRREPCPVPPGLVTCGRMGCAETREHSDLRRVFPNFHQP